MISAKVEVVKCEYQTGFDPRYTTSSSSLGLPIILCAQYNADFDGDEMNFYALTNSKSIDEAYTLGNIDGCLSDATAKGGSMGSPTYMQDRCSRLIFVKLPVTGSSGWRYSF